MWKNILKGSAIVAVLNAILAAVGIITVNRDLKKYHGQPFEDEDVM